MADMLRCRDCRWWDSTDHDPGEGACSRLTVYERPGWFRVCVGQPLSGSHLITGELFGCTQGDAKS